MPKIKFSTFNDQSLQGKNTFWSVLIGSRSTFSLESRIFHSISIGLIVLLIFYIPYNLYAGLYVGCISAVVLGALYSSQYYYSRFHGRQHSNTLFGIAGILVFGINYFTNSGIHGSTDLIWPVYLLLVLAISPYQQHHRWLFVYLLSFFAVHMVEYLYPSLVRYPFTVGKGQFMDRVTAFPLPVLAIYIIIRFLRRSYDTERKVAEERAIALELSNIEKNKLMSIISHDLKSPLMNIKSYLELLNAHMVDNQERSALEKGLLNSTDNAMEMLSNLLHWSKSQMEGPYVHLVEVNSLIALQSTLEMEKIHAAKKNIILDYQIPAELIVIADVDMLQLVVRNLISNAVKFTHSGGYININAQMIHHECRISVNDNGSGIPREKQERIFSIKTEPAFGTNNERGVGLGLVLCKEFIERQGGRISFESNPGIGSSFFIFIPLRR